MQALHLTYPHLESERSHKQWRGASSLGQLRGYMTWRKSWTRQKPRSRSVFDVAIRRANCKHGSIVPLNKADWALLIGLDQQTIPFAIAVLMHGCTAEHDKDCNKLLTEIFMVAYVPVYDSHMLRDFRSYGHSFTVTVISNRSRGSSSRLLLIS